jgi:hypothetical protein
MERLKGKGVEEWLNQHLTSPWDGHQTVASELGNDIIANIRERWTQLSVPVRLGVLFSLISLKKAQQLQLKDKCQEVWRSRKTFCEHHGYQYIITSSQHASSVQIQLLITRVLCSCSSAN